MGRIERTNLTAAERREAVIDAAITEFAQKGLHGTSTEDIARRVGISQPYIFRLFGTKKDLFIAAAARVCERVLNAFRQASESAPGHGMSMLDAMGDAYQGLINNREDLLMLLQILTASDDEDVRRATRDAFTRLFSYVQEQARIDAFTASAFFAKGMLLNVAVALDLPLLLGCPDWETFKEPHHMMRRQAVELIGRMGEHRREQADPPLSVLWPGEEHEDTP